MHPKLQRMWQFGLAILALAGVLSPIPNVCWVFPTGLAGFAFMLIILPLGLNRMWFFAPIRVTDAQVIIDTFALHRVLAGQDDESEIRLLVNMEFVLLYGAGGISKEIEVQWTHDIAKELSVILPIARLFRIVEFKRVEPKVIKLDLGIPESFEGSKGIPVKAPIDQILIDKLDAISKRIEEGNFRIIWKTALGGEKNI